MPYNLHTAVSAHHPSPCTLVRCPPCPTVRHKVGDARQTVGEVVCGDFAWGIEMKVVGILEVNVVAQKERIGFAVLADAPAFCDGGYNTERVVQVNESVVKQVAGPDGRLSGGEGGIETGNAGGFIVSENHLALTGIVPFACGEC